MGIDAQRELRWWDTQGLLRGLEWVVGEQETGRQENRHINIWTDGSGNQKC